jgi:hypothetical protein
MKTKLSIKIKNKEKWRFVDGMLFFLLNLALELSIFMFYL